MDSRYSQTSRGFTHASEIEGLYGGSVVVYESSGASGPQLWLKTRVPSDLNNPDSPPVETTILLARADALLLANDILTLAINHYQGPIDEVCE